VTGQLHIRISHIINEEDQQLKGISAKTLVHAFAFQAIALVALVWPCQTSAQVLEPGGHWHTIDHNLKLVLCNQDVEILNLLYNETVTSVILEDDLYHFTQPVDTFKVGYPYIVSLDGKDYSFYFTELPVVFIEMDQPISNEERRPAHFKIVESSGQFMTSDIGINIRGATSQEYPKKSMRIEFWMDPTGEESKNVSLLDLRNDDDWILLPMYNEPLRLRNATAHQLWEDIHEPYYLEVSPNARSGVRGRYIEMFKNGEYRGVYLLTERVDRKQLRLQSYSETSGMQGELYKAKHWGSGTVTFDFAGFYDNSNRWWDGYQKKYPLEEMATQWDRLFDLKLFALQSDDDLFAELIFDSFHPENAIDYFLFINLLYALDNTGKNIFVASHSEDEPYFYVPWDLDAVFGHDWRGNPTGNAHSLITNGLYDRLIDNCVTTSFGLMLSERWTALRENLITPQSLHHRLMLHHNNLYNNGVYSREEMAWPDYSYNSDAVNYMSNWIEHRIGILDELFANLCNIQNNPAKRNTPECLLFPNPSTGALGIVHKHFGERAEFTIRDHFGRMLKHGQLHRHTTHLNFSDIPAGMYHITISDDYKSETLKWVKI